MTKILVDGTLLYVIQLVNLRNDMANKLAIEKKVMVVSMLCEGASIRGIERMTGVNQNTIMSLARRVGDACAKIMDEKMRGHPPRCPTPRLRWRWTRRTGASGNSFPQRRKSGCQRLPKNAGLPPMPIAV
jgi:hypothetical protein